MALEQRETVSLIGSELTPIRPMKVVFMAADPVTVTVEAVESYCALT